MKDKLKLDKPTERELEVLTVVFRSFETGLREGTIFPKDLYPAMKMLGLNPLEQEVLDLTNEIVRNGLIYFPEFCQVVTKKYREEDEDLFRQNMFKVLCGTTPYSEKIRAKKYKLKDQFFSKKDFVHMMRNLPVQVSDSDIEEMFSYADQDCDGCINWAEFQTMVNPPKTTDQWASRPTKTNPADKINLPLPVTVQVHPHTLSVSSIMHQSETNIPLSERKLFLNQSKVFPVTVKETHIPAKWNKIGLTNPDLEN